MARIVLAHGILGFGSVLPNQPLNYFNGIPALYTSQRHDVICPTVPALGSIADRTSKLQEQILAKWPDPNDGELIYLLAHSMGGLDCRHMLTTSPDIAKRVRRLITVATPHFGSPVADAVLHPAFPELPFLAPSLAGLFQGNAGALADLQTLATVQDAEVSNVDYLCVGCDMTATTPKSLVFALTAAVGGFAPNRNDGVVDLDSASSSNDAANLFGTWPVDHGGAIGWPSGGIVDQAALATVTPRADHIARYTNLLGALLAP